MKLNAFSCKSAKSIVFMRSQDRVLNVNEST